MIAIKGGVWGREIDPDAQARSHIAAVTERMMDFAAPEMHREVGRQMTLAAPARRHGGGAARA
jgi:arsenite/tail-anchored protein-transporting ATPase